MSNEKDKSKLVDTTKIKVEIRGTTKRKLEIEIRRGKRWKQRYNKDKGRKRDTTKIIHRGKTIAKIEKLRSR